MVPFSVTVTGTVQNWLLFLVIPVGVTPLTVPLTPGFSPFGATLTTPAAFFRVRTIWGI